MASTVTLNVNGVNRSVTVSDTNMPLLWVLRDELGLTGTKYGCGIAQCGACTVHVGGRPVHSCMTPVSAVDAPVTTIEGLGTPEKPHPLQSAFVAEQAAQCGYCLNGMVMMTVSWLQRHPHPTDDQIKAALSHNLCRCGTYNRIRAAIKDAAAEMRKA